MKVSTKKEGNILHVTVIYNLNGRAADPKIRCDTGKVLEYLKENGYNNIIKTKKHDYASNFEPTRLEGNWVFLLSEPARKPTRRPQPPAPKKEFNSPKIRSKRTTVVDSCNMDNKE
jgi:hypothetical protein